MGKVVYTVIDHFDELPVASWREGDQDSYERTMQRANGMGGIRLVGRRDDSMFGLVQINFAAGLNGGVWRPVNGFHLILAKYLAAKFKERPAGDVVGVFFDRIEDTEALNAVRQIVALEVGANAAQAEIDDALRAINADMRAFGVPAGDWSFIPMQRSMALGLLSPGG